MASSPRTPAVGTYRRLVVGGGQIWRLEWHCLSDNLHGMLALGMLLPALLVGCHRSTTEHPDLAATCRRLRRPAVAAAAAAWLAPLTRLFFIEKLRWLVWAAVNRFGPETSQCAARAQD